MTDKKRSGTYARLKQHFGTTFVSLRHSNFLFCIGVIISLTGSLMQGVALGWYSYVLTGSEVLLGTVVAAGLIPSLLLGVVDVTDAEFELAGKAQFVPFGRFFAESTDSMTKAALGHFMVEVLNLA